MEDKLKLLFDSGALLNEIGKCTREHFEKENDDRIHIGSVVSVKSDKYWELGEFGVVLSTPFHTYDKKGQSIIVRLQKSGEVIMQIADLDTRGCVGV